MTRSHFGNRVVYLAGPINGCTDEEACGWRNAAIAALPGWSVRNPMDRDYRGRELPNALTLVNADKADIRASDVILVNAGRPTWGTAMEVHYAYTRRKRVIAFGFGTPSPWLAFHATDLVPTLDDALALLTPLFPPPPRTTTDE